MRRLAIRIRCYEKTGCEFGAGYGVVSKIVERLKSRHDGKLNARTAMKREQIVGIEVIRVEIGAYMRFLSVLPWSKF